MIDCHTFAAENPVLNFSAFSHWNLFGQCQRSKRNFFFPLGFHRQSWHSTIQDYANPPGASNQSLWCERNAADGWICFCWNVFMWNVPLSAWHHNGSRSLKVLRMISWRNGLFLPIIIRQSCLLYSSGDGRAKGREAKRATTAKQDAQQPEQTQSRSSWYSVIN